MNKNKMLVLDIETTGFLPQGGSIVEIGIVELDLGNGETKILLDSLCREDRLTAAHREAPFGWIFKNSSLTIEEVRDAPPFSEVAAKAQDIIDSYPLGVTAFNRNFDIPFLQSRDINFGQLQPCPMLIGTNICKLPNQNGRRGYKWPKCEEAWDFFFPGVEYIELHRGADDAKHEAMIIYEMYKRGVYEVDRS